MLQYHHKSSSKSVSLSLSLIIQKSNFGIDGLLLKCCMSHIVKCNVLANVFINLCIYSFIHSVNGLECTLCGLFHRFSLRQHRNLYKESKQKSSQWIRFLLIHKPQHTTVHCTVSHFSQSLQSVVLGNQCTTLATFKCSLCVFNFVNLKFFFVF